GLVPAHTVDRVLGAALGIRAELPRRRSRLARGIAETHHRFLPRDLAALIDESLAPELARAVPAGVDKTLECGVGDLVDVDPVVGKSDGRSPGILKRGSRNFHHLFRRA